MQANYNSSTEYYEEQPDRNTPDLKALFLKYLRYWPYVAISAILALGGAHLKNKLTHPIYKQESRFLIKEDDKNLGILDLTGLGAQGFGGQGQRLVNESLLMKSKPVAEQVLDRLDFDVEYYIPETFINKEVYKNSPIRVTLDWDHPQLTGGDIKITWNNTENFLVELLDEEYELTVPTENSKIPVENPVFPNDNFPFENWIETPLAKFHIELISPVSEGEMILRFRDKGSLISQYTGDDMQVWILDPAASILGLSIITQQPEKGQLYLNTLMEVYLDNELTEKTRVASNTVDFIDSQISGVADSLNYTSTDLQNYRASNRTYNIGSEGNTIFAQLSELEKELSQENYKREYYRKLQNYLVREEYEEILVPSGLGIDDPILNSLIENLIALQAERSRYLATQTEASPTVMEVTRKIRDLNASIKEVLQNVTENVNFVIRDLEARIARIEAEFSRLPATEQNLLRFQRKFDLNENIYTFLLQRRAEAAITMASNTASNKIVEYAGLNSQPIKTPALTNYVIAMAFGLGFPIGIIIITHLFNVKIIDIREAESKLKVPNLTHIGKNKANTSLVVLKEPRVAVTEAFRALRTNIYFIFPKDKQATIAVTSNISGEGKSFCALNLASAYSLNGKNTLLIDCDLHRGMQHSDLGIKNDIGLSSFLSGQINEVSPIIQSTSYDNLSMISGGPMPPNPGELLLNDRFDLLMKELRKRYDIIILDTPPVGLVSESLELIRNVDVTLYVLRYGYTHNASIDFVNDLRVKKGIKNIYTLFNDVPHRALYYGGYGYGYYKDDKKPLLKRLFRENKRKVAV